MVLGKKGGVRAFLSALQMCFVDCCACRMLQRAIRALYCLVHQVCHMFRVRVRRVLRVIFSVSVVIGVSSAHPVFLSRRPKHPDVLHPSLLDSLETNLQAENKCCNAEIGMLVF